jgi:hypothetical protein
MKPLTPEQIKEIAGQLDCGFRSFVSKIDGEILFIPDTFKHPDIDMHAWSDEIKKIDANFSDYMEIEQMESRDSFKIMADFVDTLPDSNSLKGRLIHALNKNKPFREFKFVIDNSGEYRQRWFDFKNQRIQQWVIDSFDAIINFEE